MELKKSPLLEFGPFRADRDARLLLQDGQVVALPPKAFDVLLTLLESDGRALTREELIAEVWGDTFVEEANLTQAISVLRKALGEDAQEPACIVTIPRRGYRFSLPVQEVVPEIIEEPLNGKAPAISESPARNSGRRANRLVWAAALGALAAAAGGAWLLLAPRSREPVRSLVVLPFLNLSGDPNNEYFSDGLTEEIINALAPVAGLRVVARTTAFQFKGRNLDVRDIGAKLHADAALEGSVRRQGGRVRITAQLDSTRDGYHYWSQTWERELKDVFAVQQEIATNVVEALGKDGGRSTPLSLPTATRNVEAYDLFLRGRYLTSRNLFSEAAPVLEKAVQQDPAFADAHAELAYTYVILGYGSEMRPKDAYPVAKRHAQRALELSPSSPSALFAQGWISTFYDWDWDGAERALRRAISGNRTIADAHHAYAHFLVAMGRFPEGLAESQRMLTDEPTSPALTGHLAWQYLFTGQPALAIPAAQHSLELDPKVDMNLIYLRWAYEATGQFEDAILTAERHYPPELIARLRSGFRFRGATGYWQAWADFSLEARRKSYYSPYWIAMVYAKLGRKEDALRWLQRGLDERDSWMVYMKVDPTFESLRREPGFQELVRKVGLP